jgi:hypothetical protein
MTRKSRFLDHEALARVRRLRKEGNLDKAERILLRGEPSPAVLDKLRTIASERARTAKNEGDWQAVIRHLEAYSNYAQQWKQHCIESEPRATSSHSARPKAA